MLHPLMYEGLLPDSRQVSRDAARRHMILAHRAERGDARRPRLRAWRRRVQTWRARLRPSRPIPQA